MRFNRAMIVSAALGLGIVVSGCSSHPKKEAAHEAVKAASPAQEAVAAKPKSSGSLLTCTKGKDERKLEVVKKGQGCELAYTKFGETKAVASSKSGTEHCEKIMERIEGKLKVASYTCQ